MKISYAITVCNELKEINRLLKHLLEFKRKEDEIVVLLDKPKASKQLELLLEGYAHSKKIVLAIDYFEGHFANWKNNLTSHCTGDYIFQIDADEIPHEALIEYLPQVLDTNPVDVVFVPRVNTVEGITDHHIFKWGWRVNEKGWVNFPDYQLRIYKRTPEVEWKNKVHETITGYTTFSNFPAEEYWSLYHPKDIKRQEKQNEFYSTI